jgi:thioredoxin reductase (NADPH)
MGPELMNAFRNQALRFKTRFLQGTILEADFSRRPFTLKLAAGQEIKARTVIIATGASAKWIGLPSERRLMGKGVSACATCDGFFFRNMDIAVIGGGDTAMEEATFLTRFAKSVTVIHRRDKLRASKVMQDKAFANPKIKFLWDTGVEEIVGEQSVTGMRLKNLKTGEAFDLSVQGVFIAIGHEPNTAAFR